MHPIGKRVRKKQALAYIASEFKLVQTFWEFGNRLPKKLHIYLPFELAILLHRIYLENTQPIVHKFRYSIVCNCKILE